MRVRLCKPPGRSMHCEGGLSFQPLRDIDNDAEFGWGQEWVETVLRLQGVEIGPAERTTINHALRQLATAPRERRTLTELEATFRTRTESWDSTLCHRRFLGRDVGLSQ